MQAILNFCEQTGFYQFFQGDNWKCAVMLLVAIILLFLGIVKKFEPLLLVPIAIGMLVTNLPGAEMFHEILFAGGHIHWDLFGGNPITAEFIAESGPGRIGSGAQQRGRGAKRFRGSY